MGILGTAVPGAGGSAYTIDNSLRFRSSASAYLNRTPASAGSRTTWTFSFWFKRGLLTSANVVFFCGGTTNWNNAQIAIDSSTDKLHFSNYNGSSGAAGELLTARVFRDPSAWYHVVCVWNTTSATSSDRMQIWVNGVRETAYSTENYPSQNQVSNNINNNVLHNIGRDSNGGGNPYDGYLAETYFIDGQALSATSFGETNASTGVWQPKAYTGTYGTNGFYLKFSDIATTSGSNAGLGKDFSGNGNYWNTNNISVTSGVTYDAMTDSPTPKSSTVGNFCTLNPLDQGGGSSSSGANLQFNSTSSDLFAAMRGTFGVTSGKWYFEATPTTFGVGAPDKIVRIGVSNTFYNIDANGGDVSPSGGSAIWDSRDNGATSYLYLNGVSGNSYAYSFTVNDVVMVAFDADTGKIWFGKNGTWNTGSPSAGTGEAATLTSGYVYTPIADGSNSTVTQFNFGQRPFSYTPPTGFNRFQTYNLPTPTIGATASSQANKYFDVTLYTGTGSTLAITNSGSMQPAFVWDKLRSGGSNSHRLFDAVRGVEKALYSNLTNAEATESGTLTSFNSNGFTLGSNGECNTNGSLYVAWQWNGGSSTVTNTSGSISAQVRASTTSGFSVVTYTGTGSNLTFGHGLGVKPAMVIVKPRSHADNWVVWNKNLPTPTTAYMYLNGTDASANTSVFWNSTEPTSTVVSIGVNSNTNQNGGTYVAYCFAEVAGFSKFGSYTGNGSTDGPFIYTGFRPKFILIKASTTAQSWQIYDTARSPNNLNSLVLFPNLSNAEQNQSSVASLDALSNGFKLRVSDAGSNGAYTYIYMAFAESPFNYSLAR